MPQFFFCSLRVPKVLVIAAIFSALLCTGCDKDGTKPRSLWHDKYGWNPEFYFRNERLTIELCYAIETGDLNELERLMEAGANINSRGIADVTPLLWSYPCENADVFLRLLEHGADPNVLIRSNLNTQGRLKTGTSVTHLATLNPDRRYFDAVFRHGGDPNLKTELATGLDDSPLFQLIKWGGADKKERLQMLVSYGADLDGFSMAVTPPMAAASWMGQYDLALLFLKAGADMSVRKENGVMQLVHFVERDRTRPKSKEQLASYNELKKWMKAHGASFRQARADIDRWKSTPNFDVREERKRLLAADAAARRKARQLEKEPAMSDSD